MLTNEKPEGDIDAIQKAKTFYASCMDLGKVFIKN